MDIRSFSKDDVFDGIKNSNKADIEDNIRILFSPISITKGNLRQVCEIYGSIYGDEFESIIIIEDSDEFLKKRLPMSSHESYETPFGLVQVHDKNRNELCDEEDDLYVDDSGYNLNMSLFQQLMMLQTTLTDFSVVSIQISKDERPAIVRELSYVLSELHELRNTLLIFCCKLDVNHKEEYDRIKTAISSKDRSTLLNTAFSEDSNIAGRGSFVTGVMVSENWGIEIEFLPTRTIPNEDESLLAGIAYKKAKVV